MGRHVAWLSKCLRINEDKKNLGWQERHQRRWALRTYAVQYHVILAFTIPRRGQISRFQDSVYFLETAGRFNFFVFDTEIRFATIIRSDIESHILIGIDNEKVTLYTIRKIALTSIAWKLYNPGWAIYMYQMERRSRAEGPTELWARSDRKAR